MIKSATKDEKVGHLPALHNPRIRSPPPTQLRPDRVSRHILTSTGYPPSLSLLSLLHSVFRCGPTSFWVWVGAPGLRRGLCPVNVNVGLHVGLTDWRLASVSLTVSTASLFSLASLLRHIRFSVHPRVRASSSCRAHAFSVDAVCMRERERIDCRIDPHPVALLLLVPSLLDQNPNCPHHIPTPKDAIPWLSPHCAGTYSPDGLTTPLRVSPHSSSSSCKREGSPRLRSTRAASCTTSCMARRTPRRR